MPAFHPLLHPYLGPDAPEIGYSIAQRHLPAECREPLSPAAVKWLRRWPFEINRESMRQGYRAPLTGTQINIWNGLVSRAARGIYNSGRWVLRWFTTAGVATISRAMHRFQQFGMGQVQHMTRQGDDGRPLWTHAAFVFYLPDHLTSPAIEGSAAPEVVLQAPERQEDDLEIEQADAEPECGKVADILEIIPNNTQRTVDQNDPGVTPQKIKKESPPPSLTTYLPRARNEPVPQRPLSDRPPLGVERRAPWSVMPAMPALTGERLRERLGEYAVKLTNVLRAVQSTLAVMDGVTAPLLTRAQSDALVEADSDLRWEMAVTGSRALPSPFAEPDPDAEEADAEVSAAAVWAIVGDLPPD